MPSYSEVKGLALLRAGRKITPLRTAVSTLFAALAREGVSGAGGYEGERRVAEICKQLESAFRKEFSIPDYETVYVYRGDMSLDEFTYMLADAIRQRVKSVEDDEFCGVVKDALSAHIFRPHLDVNHLYAR